MTTRISAMAAWMAESAVAFVLMVGGLGVPGALAAGSALPGKTYSWTFEADTLGQAPAASRTASGRWAVVEDSTEAGVRLLRQVEDDDGLGSHVLQFLKPKVADQETSVRYRIRSGDIDPSVGLALHLDTKGKNGYLIRVSGRDGELIAHYILNGKRRDMKVVSLAPQEPGVWHTLGVRRMGERIEVRYDGVVKMKLRDERFREGNIGLWTEDDTVADFAGLTVRTLATR